MEPTTSAIDLAKRVFQTHFVDPATGAMHKKVLKRAQLVPFFANRPASRVVMERAAAPIPGPECWRGLVMTYGSSQPSSCGRS